MKVLIATAAAGAGHLQAALALEEAWKRMRSRDILKRVDTLEFTPRLYRKAYAEGYVRIAEKTPELYAHAFRKTDNPVFVKKMTQWRRLTARMVARRFIRLVDEFKPDVVICPHFLPMETLGSIRGHRGHHQPFIVTVVTDFEAHALWMEPCVDLYAVAMHETKARLVARGVPAQKVVVTGIPVSERFMKPIPIRNVRRIYKLRSGKPVLLVLGGGLGMGPLAETLAEIDKVPRDIQVLVVAGRNEKLRQTLLGKRYRQHVQVLGFVTNMEELMSVSDLIITKPGGLTSSEALALGKPLLIVNPLPGQEAANSDFLLEHGVAAKINRLEDLPSRLETLLRPSRVTKMAQAAKCLGRPKAAMEICKAALKLLLALAVFFAGTPRVRAECPVRGEEEMILFPTSATQSRDGKSWNAEIHGWIFNPKRDSVARAATQRVVMKSLDIPNLSAESDLFKERMAYFLVDNKDERSIPLELNGHRATVGRSDESGHLHGSVSMAVLASTVNPVTVQAEGCSKNTNIHNGQLWLIPPKGISVVSDIDDTIKRSNVNDHEELMANTFVRPYEAIPGMAALYQGWARQGAVFHYLSASPWPLYPAFHDFLNSAGFPEGPIVMKHVRFKSRSVLSLFKDPGQYKRPLLRELLQRYPERDFILIGDSGEKDPEVYGQIAREFGSQVRCILIRDLHPEFDSQARFRKAFRGLPTYQWRMFAEPGDVKDALTREIIGVRDEWKAVLHYRAGLQAVLQFAQSRPDLFPIARMAHARLMPRHDKEELWSTWKTFLEYVLALDSLQASHVALPRPGIGVDREAFLVRYGAFVAQYRWALSFMDRLDHDPGFRKVLNEPVPELGLENGTLDRLNFRFLNAAPAAQFVALGAIYKSLGGGESPELRQAIEEDAAAIRKLGHHRGELLTFKNALEIMRNAGFATWFPVQTGVSEWMGDTKVWRVHESLIKPDHISQMRATLLPGDILLERREWYLSNIGLPGYWPHAAIYVGTPAERRAYLGDAVESALQKKYPKAYADSLAPFEGHPPAVLEAMSEGVVFTSLEHSGAADSLVVLRPRLSKEEKAEALFRAFHYAGRPYDFNFDFATDSSIVCSELVFKAYEPSPNMKGIRFAWETMLGRPVASPNRMAQQFDEEYGTPQQQMDMILFLDGNEHSGTAYPATLETFRESWKRPKWHIWVQEKPPA